jgi:soluble P-type ATPase
VRIEVPNQPSLELNHLALDYTGTLSLDGVMIQGVRERLGLLSKELKIHVLTADTFGRASRELENLFLETTILNTPHEDRAKEEFVAFLGSDRVAAIGNGNNDALMLKRAALGIAVVGPEGCSVAALMNADIVVNSINDALDLLLNPLRIKAGLRR